MGIEEPFVVRGGYRDLHGVPCVMIVAHGQTWLAGYRKCSACLRAKAKCSGEPIEGKCDGMQPVMARVPDDEG